MKTMTATEASRGFSDLLDAVEQGETVTVTRGGNVIAEIRPARRRTGRELRLAFEASGGHLNADDAEDMHRILDETRSLPVPDDGNSWGDD